MSVDKKDYDALKAERDQLKIDYSFAVLVAQNYSKTITSMESDLTRHKELLKHMTLERDTYARCMAIALKEGLFPLKELVMNQIQKALKEIGGVDETTKT